MSMDYISFPRASFARDITDAIDNEYSSFIFHFI
jgi:hypothetical protein